jgi:erythronate-4-phosphate dehydrogenase
VSLRQIVVDDAIAHAANAFAELGDIHPLPAHAITKTSLAQLRPDALVVRSVTRIDAELLDAAPSLRFVGTATAGIDHLDLVALREREITWASADGCNAQAVAEWVVAALTLVEDRLPSAALSLPIGVVGFGNVGSRLTRLLRALGHDVLVCDPPLRRQGAAREPFVGFAELWQRCAVVSFHVPLMSEGADTTLAYVDRDTPTAAIPKLLINTSRGPVLPDRALDRPDVLALILDVWDGEPELAWARLRDPRLWLASPHVAGYSLEAKLAATRMMHEALCAYVGRTPSWTEGSLLETASLNGPLEGFSTPARVMARVIDLAGDDARVRALLELPTATRAGAFERLRRGYSLRREFRSWSVHGSRSPDLDAWLRAAGFADSV